MTYEIRVKNNHPTVVSPGHEKKLEVYHDSDEDQCDNKKCVLAPTGSGSVKFFPLSSSGEDFLEIKFKDQNTPIGSEYYIELPVNAFYHFTPNGDYNSGDATGIRVERDGRTNKTRLRIPGGQVPAWSLRVIRPIKADRVKPPDDNVTVSEDAH